MQRYIVGAAEFTSRKDTRQFGAQPVDLEPSIGLASLGATPSAAASFEVAGLPRSSRICESAGH